MIALAVKARTVKFVILNAFFFFLFSQMITRTEETDKEVRELKRDVSF